MALKDLFSAKGELDKLLITSFKDEQYSKPKETFEVMYNPTSFSQEFKSKWIPEQGLTDGKQYQFRTLESESVAFEFLFDATLASPPGKNSRQKASVSYQGIETQINKPTSATGIIMEDRHVDQAIRKFFEITQNIQSDSHKPNHLQINWGAFQFRGVLGSATVNYKLFNSAGLPIRATVSANFDQSLSRQEQAAEAGRTSPDLTHIRVVNAGDTLPIMCKRIYGSTEFYLEVARVNKLRNFRNLEVGQEVFFPPLAKS